MKTVKLIEIFDFIGGGTPSKKEPSYWNGNLNWASVKDIKGNFLTTTEEYITTEGFNHSASNIAKPNELILVTRISPGKTIITKIETSINQDLKIVRPRIPVCIKYASYFFKAHEKEVIKKSSGTTVLGITLNTLNEFRFPLVPLKEQEQLVNKIDELFSAIDKGLEELKTAQQQLKVYHQAVLKWAFEGKLTNKNVKEGEMPKEWDMKNIMQVASINPKIPNRENVDDDLEIQFFSQ